MSAAIGHRAAREMTSPRPPRNPPRKRARGRIPLPPLIALGGFGLVGLLALMPAAPDDGAKPIAQLMLVASTTPDETLDVRAAGDGRLVARFPGSVDSFVRGVFHSLVTYRHLQHVTDGAPYKLAEMSDGRVLLTDPSTRTTIDLEGFGSANASKFTSLLGLPPIKGAL